MMAISLQVVAYLNKLWFPDGYFLLKIDADVHGAEDSTRQHEKQLIYIVASDRSTAESPFGPKSMASIVLHAKDHKKRWKSIIIPTCYLTALSHYLRSDEVANSQPSEDCIGLSPLPWGFLQVRICKCSSLKIINFWWLGLVSAIVRGGVSLECWESLGTWSASKIKYSLIWQYNLQPHAW